MDKRTKICFVGGGSVKWAQFIVKDILTMPSLSDVHVVLLDIDLAAARRVKAYLDVLCGVLKVKPRIEASDQQAHALKDADYVIITISTGGFNAMAKDLSIPEAYGIYHTVGDTSGPGGWARCIRNYEVFANLGRDIQRHAPGAMVLNYTNPMSTLTRVLSLHCSNPVVGLCHGLFENLAFFQKFYRLKSEDDISCRYGGLNHFFFMSEIRTGNRDLLQDMIRRTRRRSLTDMRRIVYKDQMGFGSDRELATELLRLTGWMPYLGDRHTCEFVPPYITNRAAMKTYRLKRTTIQERREGHRKVRNTMLRMTRQGIDDERYIKRSRETAADIIAAHVENRSFIDVGNLPNIGQMPSLPEGVVVETAVRVDRLGFTPLTFRPLPPVIQAMMLPIALTYEMTVDACCAGDRELALRALQVDPVCAHLTARQVNEMGLKLLRAHKRYIHAFKP